MKTGAPSAFGAYLKTLRESAGFTQQELATISGLSVHAVSALERGERRRPHVDTVRALAAALDLVESTRDTFMRVARAPVDDAAADELSGLALPVALTSLIGRDDDVEVLLRWIGKDGVRLVTLVGPGGVGKTRLALEVGRRIEESGRARAILVELASVRDPAFVSVAIAQALGFSDVAASDLSRRVRVANGDERPLVLILDNCEQVIDAAPLAAELAADVPSLRILATSRAPLRIRGERQYIVEPLACPSEADTLSPPDLALLPAVRLFVERVRDVQPAFRLTAANARPVVAICRRLDGLPLALELAAPWMKALTADEVLHRLTHDVLLSSPGARDLPERQQTITTTVAWSYHLLDAGEQRAFRRFGVLPGRFGAAAAGAVMAGGQHAPDGDEAPLAAVVGLIDKSLLSRADPIVASRPQYQMLETVRAFASAQLDAMGERDDALAGLSRYCQHEASAAERGLVGPDQGIWLSRVRENLDNYRCVLAWLVERDRASEAADMAWQLMFFWLIRGRSGEGLRWYERTLASAKLPPAAESRALMGAAIMSYTRGDVAAARARVMETLTVSKAVGDRVVAVHAEHLLGHVEQVSGNLEGARTLYTQSVGAFRDLGLPWGTGNALIGLASAALATGDTEGAARWLDEATSALRDAGPWFLNLPLYVRAIMAVRRGATDATIAHVRESLICSRQLHDRFAFVYALIPLAAAAAQRGDAAWVARILGMRDAVTERSGTTVSDASLKALREQAEKDARDRLGPDRWAKAYAAGRSASIDSLLNDIDHATS